jgi:hypothetical protein
MPYVNHESENRRLRPEYEQLPKVPGHGGSATVRHADVPPEWIMRVITEPYDQWEEVNPDNGEVRPTSPGGYEKPANELRLYSWAWATPVRI